MKKVVENLEVVNDFEDVFEFEGVKLKAVIDRTGDPCFKCFFKDEHCFKLRSEKIIPSCRAVNRQGATEVYFTKED